MRFLADSLLSREVERLLTLMISGEEHNISFSYTHNLSNSTSVILLEILLVRCETFVFIFFISITLYLISFSFILYIRFLDKASMQLKEGSFAID